MSPAPNKNPPRAGTSATWVAAGLALFLVGAGNVRLWMALASGPSAVSWGARAAAFLALLALFTLLLELLAWPWLFKPLGAALLLVAAVASSVMLDYGVLVDESMIRNVVQTDVAEAGELLSLRALVFVLLTGVLPAVVLARTRLAFGPLRRELARRAALVLALLLAAGALAWPNYRELSSTVRNDPTLQLMVNPLTPLSALVAHARDRGGAAPVVAPFATDARRDPAPAGRRTILVFVLGETARADHFALNGYERDTNPELRTRDVLSFPDVTACGTSTADALPCLFAAHAQGEDPGEGHEDRENLLDVVQRAGLAVQWLDNNSGCKGLCARVHFEVARAPPELCNGSDPYDEALLSGLQSRLDAAPGDLFLVLHQRGSHGPAYHRRTPPAFKVFQPECASDDLQACERGQVVNAYDNTILYTDHVLAGLIDILQANAPQADVAMLYVSDHGESLGENGVWLHGFPTFMAPREQLHVPMIWWSSPGFLAANGLEPAALPAAAAGSYTHANVFHTVLGLLDIESAAYEPALDVFAAVRRG